MWLEILRVACLFSTGQVPLVEGLLCASPGHVLYLDALLNHHHHIPIIYFSLIIIIVIPI